MEAVTFLYFDLLTFSDNSEENKVFQTINMNTVPAGMICTNLDAV